MSNTQSLLEVASQKLASEETALAQRLEHYTAAQRRASDAQSALAHTTNYVIELREQRDILLEKLKQEAATRASKETGDSIRAEADAALSALKDELASAKRELEYAKSQRRIDY